MKMGFLLKNNARKGMGGKGVLKKGEEKKAEKGLQNSQILKRMAGWAEIRKFWRLGKLCLKTSELAPMLS